MAINISKAVDKQYLIDQLKAFEKYALWDQIDRQVVDVPGHYNVGVTTGLTVVADGALSDPTTEIEISNVTPVLAGVIVNIGDIVEWVNDTYKTVQIWVHRYDKLMPWETGKKYFIGQCATYDNCLYEAIADVDGTDLTFPENKFRMVGADSLLQIRRNALDDPATVKQDCVYWLMEDEIDTTDPSNPVVVHKAGIYTFTKATNTYELYREYDEQDLEVKSFFEVVDPSELGYQGNEKLAVSSKYLHKQMQNLTAVIQEEIDDLYDIAGNAIYRIVEDKDALNAIDLSTLEDNTFNIFLVKQDNTVEDGPNPQTQSADEFTDGTTTISAVQMDVLRKEYAIDVAAGTTFVTDPDTVYSSTGTPVTVNVYKFEENANPGTFITQDAYNQLEAQYLYDIASGAASPSTDPSTLYTSVQVMEQIEPYLIPGTNPKEYESTLYACIAYDSEGYPTTPRTMEFIGKLNYGEHSITSLITEMIRKALYTYINTGATYYIQSTSSTPGALEVVADSAQTVTAGQIKKSDVTMAYGQNCVVGDYVEAQTATEEMATNKPIYVRRDEVDVPVLQYVHDEVTTYTDPEGVDPDVKITRLTYQGTQLMPYEFEQNNIDFTDNDEYEQTEEGDVVGP